MSFTGALCGFTVSLTYNEKVPLKHPIPVNTSPYPSGNFDVHLSVGFCACFCNKVVYFMISFVVHMWVICNAPLWFGLILLCFLINLPFLCGFFVVWQLMLSSCRHSSSNIPSNTGPFPYTMKKLHQYPMRLLIYKVLLVYLNIQQLVIALES